MIRPLFPMRRLFLYACAVLGPLLPLLTTPLSALDGADEILVFSHTAGFRHDSIPAAVSAIGGLGNAHGFAVHATEDRSVFNDEALDHYRAVVFLNTTGDILDPDQEAAFQRFIQRGGGFVGIHAAADTEYEWTWYGQLVGAYFDSHPHIQPAEIRVIDTVHPSTTMLPRRWLRTDEWYNYRMNPRGRVHVLAVLDEASYEGGNQGIDHPIAWCHAYEGGRSWYTGGGHTAESYSEELFLQHLLGGIQYAAGLADGDCGASMDSNYEKVILDDSTQNPIALDITADGRVFFVERGGALKVHQPSSGRTEVVGRLSVTTEFEDGLLGIALAPDFATSNHLYLFYSPSGSEAVQRVSRFTLRDGQLDLSSERIVLRIPTQREECCHSGGALLFDENGVLYISVGDNTNPFASDGYTPIDERAGRAAWDAQRTSANTRDLRGKILRIIPQADGSYRTPDDNLFSQRPGDGLPEIFVMGVRNPFRMSLDAKRGWLYWGDVGPDAGAASAQRGPEGLDEWNRTRTAGHFGWPYCIGDNRPYVDFQFTADGDGTSGAPFDCGAPTNDSPNNTGLQNLPPAQPAWIWYPYGGSDDFPALGAAEGRTAMAGPVYYHQSTSPTALPPYYDGSFILYEWVRNWLRVAHFDEAGNLLQIDPLFSTIEFQRPIDMKVGPDGALYAIEWGTGFWGDNPDAQLVRLQYARGGRPPTARLEAAPTDGSVPLTVAFDARDSYDPDPGSRLSYAWDIDSDGTVDSRSSQLTHTYSLPGNYTATLTVTDESGEQSSAQSAISAGNTRPNVRLAWPPDGGIFDWGDSIPFRVEVTDAEDAVIDCDRVRVQAFVGHDDHSHPQEQYGRCQGAIETISGHGSEADDLFYVVEALYEDGGADGVDPLISSTGIVLQPRRKEAEHYTQQQGVQLESTGDTQGGGKNIGWIEHGDYIAFNPISLTGIDSLTFRVASANAGGFIDVRLDGAEGPFLWRVRVPSTGAWQQYTDVGLSVSDPGGTHALFFVFTRATDDNQSLFNINWIDFHGPGLRTMPSTAVAHAAARPRPFTLHPAYPNPSNGSVVFSFGVPNQMHVRLDLFNALGQLVQRVLEAPYAPGVHRIPFDTSALASGLYFYRLSAQGQSISRRIAILK